MKFTDRSIAALKPKADRYEEWSDDVGGYGVRVSKTGRKVFVYMFRVGGKQHRLKLGLFGTPPVGITLADANLLLAQARKAIAAGENPAAVAATDKATERAAETVAELAALYMEVWAPRKRSAAEDQRMLNRDVLPRWADRKAKDISRRDVVALLDAVAARGAPIGANRLLSMLHKMFAFGVSRGVIGLETNPAAHVAKPAPERQRERALTDAELAQVWHRLPTARMDEPARQAIRLAILTAGRIGEVVATKFDDVDEARAEWLIPAARAKNGRGLLLPLSRQAMTVYEASRSAPERAGRMQGPGHDARTDHLFPSPRQGCGHISPGAVAHALLRNLEHFGVPPFTAHDLRRTAATGMARLGVARHVIKGVLNHVDRAVTATYDRHDMMPEKREALERWGRHVEGVVGLGATADVLPFGARANG